MTIYEPKMDTTNVVRLVFSAKKVELNSQHTDVRKQVATRVGRCVRLARTANVVSRKLRYEIDLRFGGNKLRRQRQPVGLRQRGVVDVDTLQAAGVFVFGANGAVGVVAAVRQSPVVVMMMFAASVFVCVMMHIVARTFERKHSPALFGTRLAAVVSHIGTATEKQEKCDKTAQNRMQKYLSHRFRLQNYNFFRKETQFLDIFL